LSLGGSHLYLIVIIIMKFGNSMNYKTIFYHSVENT
jgi:hypothetical protein